MNFHVTVSLLCSMIMAIIAAKIFIPMLRKFKFGQTVREDGPKNHVVKNGTPTIGGLIFIIPIIIASAIFLKVEVRAMYPVLSLSLFAIIGFLDDYLKIRRGKNLGLTAKQKMVLLIVVSFVLSVLAKSVYGSDIIIPFLDVTVDLGNVYIPFMMFVYIGASNAVNLTDGLDGLASSVTVVVLFFIGLISFSMGMSDTVVVSNIAIGAIIGFLIFNVYPAKIFMGDTGSLALGGMLVALTVQMKLPLILILLGVMYIVETLSVIIQVISFKLTGKRVFKMSPIHHHFEMCGMSENAIVIRFVVISVVFGIITLLAV